MLGMLTRNANIPFVIRLCMGMHVAMHLGTSARTDMDTLDIFIIKTYQYVVTDDHASLCRSGPGNKLSHDAYRWTPKSGANTG
jgi:hypothetical protein